MLHLVGCQVPTKAALSHPLVSGTREKKYNDKVVGQDEDRERSVNQLPPRLKQT